MPIDPQKALGAELPSVEAAWDADRLILYHLGVGAGAPQTDPGELEYTYEKNLKVLPSYGVIPAFPVMAGLAQVPGMDFNFAMLLHGEQDLEVHERPIPTQAQVTTTGKVAGLYDKKKACLAIIEAETRDASGGLLFVNRFSLFLRGEGGFGGERGPSAAFELPSRAPDHEVTYGTREDQALIYRLSGDRNPLHSDPSFARMGGFDRPILHGLCTYGFTGRALLHTLCGSDPARFQSMYGRFSKPVLPGEALTVRMWVDGQEAVFQTTNPKGEVVLDQGRFTFSG